MNETKEQAASRIYTGITFDTALPQGWVNDAYPFEVVPCFVWGYPAGSLFGIPLPLTKAADKWLRTRDRFERTADFAQGYRQGELID